MILLIDNYDSFVYNLARYFKRLGQETLVVRNDAIAVSDVQRLAPDALVLSPGPCTPVQAGCSVELVKEFYRTIPILGVCLGHQAIAAAMGAKVVRAPEAIHGRTSLIDHNDTSIFAGLPSPLKVCRYHSLIVDAASLPSHLNVTARTRDGLIMAISHTDFPVVGVQFHPEATLTDFGYQMLTNFLHLTGILDVAPASHWLDVEFPYRVDTPVAVTVGPVTF